jgi:hypothetical protein
MGIAVGIAPFGDPKMENFFPVGIYEKVPPKEVWGWRRYFTPHPTESPSLKNLLK